MAFRTKTINNSNFEHIFTYKLKINKNENELCSQKIDHQVKDKCSSIKMIFMNLCIVMFCFSFITILITSSASIKYQVLPYRSVRSVRLGFIYFYLLFYRIFLLLIPKDSSLSLLNYSRFECQDIRPIV